MLRRSPSRPLRVLLVALMVVAGCAWFATTAGAHSILVATDPAPGAELVSLDQVRFEFASEVASDGHSVVVVGPGGEVPASAVERTDRSTVLARFEPGAIEPGRQEIRWQVVGGDGHTERGIVPVTVAAASAAATSTTAPPDQGDGPVGTASTVPVGTPPVAPAASAGAAAPATADDDGLAAGAVIGLVVLVAVAASGLAYGVRRRRRRAAS